LFTRRLPFLAAIGLIAAAIGDAALEAAANAGAFGGLYRDADQLGIGPALLLGLGPIIVALSALAYRLARAGGRPARLTPGDVATAFASALAGAYAIQALETLYAGGSVGGGLAWLGGPPLVGLATYALLTFVTLVVARVVLGALTAAVAVAIVLAAVLLAIAGRGLIAPAFDARRVRLAPLRRGSPLVRHAAGRAPPLRLSV